MPGYVQPTAQVPRTSTDLPTQGTMQWFPERKIVWAECTMPVSRFDLLVFDMDASGRDLTSFDIDHPWNFVHPARVAYNAPAVFSAPYVLDAGSAAWVIGEVIDDDASAGAGIVYRVEETHNLGTDVRSGTMTYRRTDLGIGTGDAVTGGTSLATGDLGTVAAHTQYMGPLWTYGIAQSSGQVGDRIGVQTRGVGEVACVAAVTAGQYMIADEDLPQITPNVATNDPLMVIARTQTAVASGRCWVIFNGERGIGTNMDTE